MFFFKFLNIINGSCPIDILYDLQKKPLLFKNISEIVKVDLPSQIIIDDKNCLNELKTYKNSFFEDNNIPEQENIYYFVIDKSYLTIYDFIKRKNYKYEFDNFYWDIETLDESDVMFLTSILETYINSIKEKCTIYVCAFKLKVNDKNLFRKKYIIENQIYLDLEINHPIKFVDFNFLNRNFSIYNSYDFIRIKENQKYYYFPVFYKDINLESLFKIINTENNMMTDFLPITVFHDVSLLIYDLICRDKKKLQKFIDAFIIDTKQSDEFCCNILCRFIEDNDIIYKMFMNSDKHTKDLINYYKVYISDLKTKLNLLNGRSTDKDILLKERNRILAKYLKIFQFFYNTNKKLFLEKITELLNDKTKNGDIIFQFNFKMMKIFIAIKTRIQRFFLNFDHIPVMQVDDTIIACHNHMSNTYDPFVKKFADQNNIFADIRIINKSDWAKLKFFAHNY